MFMFIANLCKRLVDGISLFFIFKCFHQFLEVFFIDIFKSKLDIFYD